MKESKLTKDVRIVRLHSETFGQGEAEREFFAQLEVRREHEVLLPGGRVLLVGSVVRGLIETDASWSFPWTARITFVREDLDPDLEVPFDIPMLIHDRNLVEEGDWVEEVAQVDVGSPNEAEPGETVLRPNQSPFILP